MDARTVQAAITQQNLDQRGACLALRVYAIPILRELRDRASGWRLVYRLALSVVIAALEAYVREACGAD